MAKKHKKLVQKTNFAHYTICKSLIPDLTKSVTQEVNYQLKQKIWKSKSKVLTKEQLNLALRSKIFRIRLKAKKEAGSHAQNLIEKYKSQQDNVRNNKEFEALGKEIEFQELEIQLADKKIREFNAKIDHKNEVLAEVNAKIDELTNHLNFKKNELDGLVSETQKEEEYLQRNLKSFLKKLTTDFYLLTTESEQVLQTVQQQQVSKEVLLKVLTSLFHHKSNLKLLRERELSLMSTLVKSLLTTSW